MRWFHFAHLRPTMWRRLGRSSMMVGAASSVAPTPRTLPMAAVRFGEVAQGDELARQAAQWWGDSASLSLGWRLGFDGWKARRGVLYIAEVVCGISGKDSRPLLSLNLVLIPCWLGFVFSSEFGDMLSCLILFDLLWSGAQGKESKRPWGWRGMETKATQAKHDTGVGMGSWWRGSS
jgi:hypothetical protein